jgi:chaperonin GroES
MTAKASGANPATDSTIQPLADYVVARGEEAAAKTASGLYLPDNAKEKPKTVLIVGVGPQVTQVKVGDRVIYKSFSSTEIKVDGVEYAIIKEEDVIAKVK